MRADADQTTSSTWRPAGEIDQLTGGTTDARRRIVDAQGRAVAGARFWVLAVKSPQDGDRDGLLARLSATREFNAQWLAWQDLRDASPGSPGASAARRGEPESVPKIGPPATSDQNGRILLEVVGADRLVLALIEGPGIESQLAIIVTRPGPPILVQGRGGLIVHGSGFKYVAAGSRAIEGIVRDGKTGLPIPGVSIRGAATLSFTGLTRYVRTKTDSAGRYRLMGIALGAEDRLLAMPPAESAFPPVTQSINVAAENGPASLDLTLKKGVWIQGRVIDAASGEPLDADVEYHAFNDNPHVGPKAAFEMKNTRTETDGSFRLLGLPGRGFVAAKTFDGRFVRGAEELTVEAGKSKDLGAVKVIDTTH